MWTRRPQILWFRIEYRNHKNLRLSLPVTLSVLQELLDCALDLLVLLGMLAPNASLGNPQLSAGRLQELIPMLKQLLYSISKDGPYELIDISTDQVSLSIRVK